MKPDDALLGASQRPSPAHSLRRALTAWNPQRHPWWLRVLVALVITATAIWLRWAMAPGDGGGRYFILSLAAAVCALYGGFRIGMLSVLLSMAVVNLVILKSFTAEALVTVETAISLNFWYLLTQSVVVGSIALMQRQARQLRASMAQARASHQHMLDTFESVTMGMAHTQPDGPWIRVNRRYGDILGYTPEEMMRSDWRRFTHPDDLPGDLQQKARMLRGEIDHYTREKRYIHRQGHVIWVMVAASLIRKPDGTPDYEIVVVQDISARKATEEALRTSESLLLQAQELAQMASWRYDAATRRFTLLGNAQLLLGVQREHFSDQDMIGATHPKDRERVRQAWHAAFSNGEAHEIEFRLRLSGDEWRWVSVCAEFDRDATGRVSSGLGTVLDISAHKRAEQQIHQLNASLEQRIGERTQALLAAYDELESFSYAVAHDLRSPLRIINGFAQALEEDNPALAPDSHQHLQRIREASKKMGELIDGLLKLSQMSRGELQRTPVDLSAMATRQLRELAAASPERQVDWQVQPGLVAMADAALMEALLQNLLHNAWKYSSQTPQAQIRFYGRERPGAREFVVEDNGAGFDMQRAHQLFQPFQRLHHAKAFQGLGIGLATARRIVLRHGGELRADSEPGRGARFFFTLTPPLERQTARQP